MALRTAVETKNESNTFDELSSLKVKLIQQSIQLAVDYQSYKYQLPIFVINDPLGYKQRTEEFKTVDSNTKVEITLRYYSVDKKLEVEMQTSIKLLLEEALKIVKEDTSYKEEEEGIKLLFRGKILEESKVIGNYIQKAEII